MNGFYAWEGMFSSKENTSDAVITGISLYAEKEYDRICEMYDLYRSAKVHGDNFKLKEGETLESIKEETLNIAIICLKKLLEDPELLKYKPSNRVKKLKEKYNI